MNILLFYYYLKSLDADILLYILNITGAQEEVVEGSTVYAQVEAEDQTREKTGDNRPITVYCTLGQHQKPTIHPEIDHTVYSVLYKQPNKNPSAISPDDT